MITIITPDITGATPHYLQEHDLTVGPLGISLVREGIKYLLESHNFTCSAIYTLPDYTVGLGEWGSGSITSQTLSKVGEGLGQFLYTTRGALPTFSRRDKWLTREKVGNVSRD